MKKLLWLLLAGTRGGITRAKIIKKLQERPYNVHQLAEQLGFDYKTVKHHIKVLEENDVITSPESKKYGALYFLSSQMELHYDMFVQIWEQIEEVNTK